jgi:hypothetical protein
MILRLRYVPAMMRMFVLSTLYSVLG